MDRTIDELADKLISRHALEHDEYAELITHADEKVASRLAEEAVRIRRAIYGNTVFSRGLIEFTNHCRNDCRYCGIRVGNLSCERYRLSDEQILSCARDGYGLGFRTFVLQGGEDPRYDDDRLCAIVRALKREFPDCAVTLSIGERTFDSYRRLREAGADRYLLRHETADCDHYGLLHPPSMSYENRMRCLGYLRELGYAVGTGFMVGSPYQTADNLASDLEFIAEFQPDMCGIGPFIPHHATEFADFPPGTLEQTCLLLSVIRILCPAVLLPATTALGTIDPHGREKGILSGANVVMPNLSPVAVRSKYELYDDKICTGDEAAECRHCLEARIASIGYEMVVDRGDARRLEVMEA